MTHPSAAIGSRCIFVIYDRVSESFIGHPVLERHPAPAVRLFNQLLDDRSTGPGQHPKDYELLQVGFIEDSGQILAIEPMTVTTGIAYLASKEPDADARQQILSLETR